MNDNLDTSNNNQINDLKNIIEKKNQKKTEEKIYKNNKTKNSYIITEDEINCINILIDNSPHLICLKEPDGKWIRANDALEKILNLNNTEYTGMKDPEIKKK